MKFVRTVDRRFCIALAALVWVSFSSRPCLALQSFPLSAGQRGTVTCLENPAIQYDCFLPPGYLSNGNARPILYTFHPNGGGMVGYFQTVCSSMGIICVGVINSSNGAPWDVVFRDLYAVSRDIRQRVYFDPTAEMAAGFSGGGEACYEFSRFRAQHVCGILPMAGWLGRFVGVDPTNGTYYGQYYSTDRVQTNLLVARITGDSDTGTLFYLPYDSNYLATCGAVIKDWYFAGGHTISVPDSTKTAGLTWILTNRNLGGSNDRINAFFQAADWQSRITNGQPAAVFRECMSNIMTRPRSWFAYQAQLIVDQLETNYTTFRTFDVANIAQGDFSSDFFYYYGRGAGINAEMQRYYSSLKSLTGVAGANGDRFGDINALLLQFGYPAPIIQTSFNQNSGHLNLSINKDAPLLDYWLESRTNMSGDIWQTNSALATDTNTTWSAQPDLPLGADHGFYRVGTIPSAVPPSPPWPN